MMLSRSVLCSTLLATVVLFSVGCGKSQKKPTVTLNEPRGVLSGSANAKGRGANGTGAWSPDGSIPGSDAGMNGSGSTYAGTLGVGGGSLTDPSSGSYLQNGNESNVGSATEIADLDMVHFDYDSSDLNDDWKAILVNHAAWLKSNNTVNVQVEGHCDERGTDEYNIALGQRRADTIREFLIGEGVEADRITTISYGKMRPIAFDQSEESHYLNRRGMFLVYTPDFTAETAAAY